MTGGTVGILGLGLVGGSLARDLTARGVRVLAVEPDTDQLAAALEAGAVVEGGPELERLRAADGVILATPPSVTRHLLSRLPGHIPRARWVTDVCSTKRRVLEAAEAAGLAGRFVGSHPLAGGTGVGFAASRSGLFVGARVYLCDAVGPAGEGRSAPTPPAGGATGAARTAVEALWLELGATPEWTDATAHDRRLAWTSQLPQLVASALGLTQARAGLDPADLGPGGRDTTRLAASGPELWTEIAVDSGPLLLEALDAYAADLGELREALAAASGGAASGGGEDGRSALRRLLREAHVWARAVEPSRAVRRPPP